MIDFIKKNIIGAYIVGIVLLMTAIGGFFYEGNKSANTSKEVLIVSPESSPESTEDLEFGDVLSPSYFKKTVYGNGNASTSAIVPVVSNWQIGSSTTNSQWNISSTTSLCLIGDSCRDTWPTGGSGSLPAQLGQIGDVSTTTLGWGSVIRYNTATSDWESVATSTLGIIGTSQWTTSGSDIYYDTGFVGIGTTTPYALLSISNSVSTPANTPLFTIASTTAGTATTTLMTVLANGRVGIGTESPARELHVIGAVRIERSTGWGPMFDLVNTYTGGRTYSVLSANSTSPYGGGSFVISDSDAVQARLLINSSGLVGIGTTSPYALLSISNSATTAVNTPLFTIASTTAGTATSTLLTVLANGYVGIGTAGPGEPLDVVGIIRSAGTNSAPSTGAGTEIAGGSGTNYITAYNRATSAYLDLVVRANTLSLNYGGTTGLYLNSTGLVGIGTTSPNNLLSLSSSANPAVGFTTATGWGWSMGMDASDSYKFKIASSTAVGTNTRLTIGGNGNVGIGTTSPYALLSISNSATTAINTPLFTIASTTAGTATSTLLTVLANGNVGIGTAGPSTLLHIVPVTGQVDAPLFIQTGSGSGSLKIGADVNANTLTDNVRKVARIVMPRYDTSSSNILIFSGDADGSTNGVYFGGYPGGTQVAATRLSFVTGSTLTTTGGTEKMAVLSTGLVGIGTSTPLAKLNVYGGDVAFQTTVNSVTAFQILNSATSSVFTIDTIANRLTIDNASTTAWSSGYASSTLGYFGTAYIPNLGTAAGSFLAVNATGQVIATTTPASGATASDSDWTLHNSFPAACGAGDFVTAIGDTLTCNTPVGGSGGSNWSVLNNFGVPMVATTTPVWAAAGLYASSTSAVLNVQNITDAASNQVARFYANQRATPADNDQGYLSFYGDTESGAGNQEFARILWEMDDVTNTTKDSTLRFYNMFSNTLTDVMDLVGKNLTVSGSISTTNGGLTLGTAGSILSVGSTFCGSSQDFQAAANSNCLDSNYSLLSINNTTFNTVIGERNSYSPTATNSNFAHFLITSTLIGEATSGNHPLFSSLAVKPFIVTAGVATVSDTASLYIEGAATTTVVSGKNYSLWVDDVGGGGISLIDGTVLLASTTGNVGIGTTTPAMKFSVQGDALADSWNVYSDIYQGDALTKLKNIKAETGKIGDWVSVDHNSLPEGVLKNTPMTHYEKLYEPYDEVVIDNATTTRYIKNSDQTFITQDEYDKLPAEQKGKTVLDYTLQTMSISGLTQMNTRAIQQLDERLLNLETPLGSIGSDGQFNAEELKKELKKEIKEELKMEIKQMIDTAIDQRINSMSLWDLIKLKLK